MQDFERWLGEGDLTSDGRTDEIVTIVLNTPEAIGDLMDCLESQNPVVRAHTADALEKIGREKPEIFLPFIHRLLIAAEKDPLDTVQWHLAMLFGHLVLFEELIDPLTAALIEDLNKGGGFTKSWAMASLCVIGRLYPDYQGRIVGEISRFQTSSMPSVRKRAEKAMEILLKGGTIPENWVKNPAVQAKLALDE